MRIVPVVIPGIMGSSLQYDNYSYSTPLTLWSNDIRENYDRLINSPGTLAWNNNPAKASLIEQFTVSARIPLFASSLPLKRVPIWGRVLDWIHHHPTLASAATVSFGYDWRAPLNGTAKHLSDRLRIEANKDVSQPRNAEETKFLIVAHSMGGIVAMLALGEKLIDPSWIDRLVLIGTPLSGSPSAFSAACEKVNLPFFTEVFGFVRRSNTVLFYKHLLECIRTFPSIYGLLPPEEVPYLYYGHSSRSNPLRENSMPSELQTIARQTRDTVERAFNIIQSCGIDVHSIYTEVNTNKKTELEYRVTPHGNNYGYTIEECIASTIYGDGTVPSDSARGPSNLKHLTVVNVDHAFLCNNPTVVECLTALIPQGSYAS
jgi:pimeloyl-ACP methyl ester carboxylesterase